jgi:hypothetical protein
MNQKQFLLTVCILCLCCFPNLAAQDTMAIGGISLELGMSKEEVTELFQGLSAEFFKTNYDPGINSMSIMTRLTGQWELAGMITFGKDDLVSEVSRHWTSSTNKGAYQLGKAIYGALSSIGKDNAAIALVETRIEVFPQLGEYRTIIMTVGDKEFSLGVPDAGSGVSVTLREKLIAK